jgi:hypothetical protein
VDLLFVSDTILLFIPREMLQKTKVKRICYACCATLKSQTNMTCPIHSIPIDSMIMSLPCVIPPSLHIKNPQKKERRKKQYIPTLCHPSSHLKFKSNNIPFHPILRTPKSHHAKKKRLRRMLKLDLPNNSLHTQPLQKPTQILFPDLNHTRLETIHSDARACFTNDLLERVSESISSVLRFGGVLVIV